MSDIFEQASLFREFRQFCTDNSGELADKFNRSMDQWDPHVLLLLNGLLFVGSQLQGHTDQRMNELLQQIVYHYAPGEVMARPAVHILHFQTDTTRFQPGILPILEPLSSLRDDNHHVLGHLGAAPFHLHPGLSIAGISALTDADATGVRFSLESTMPIQANMPPVRCYLLDGPSDVNYQLLDLLCFPGAGSPLAGVSVVSAPQAFSMLWQGTPWYQHQMRYLEPYPGDLDLFFEIRGLQPKHWEERGGVWKTEVDVLLPAGCSLAQPKSLSTLKIKANTTPVFGYQQTPDVLLKGHQQELVSQRAEQVIWMRAWEKNQLLMQPGSLYFGDLLEQSEPHLWFWAPAQDSPLIAELRAAEREVRIESLVALDRRELWQRKRIENVIMEWDAAPKLKKQYDAGVILFPVGQVPMLPRLGPVQIRQQMWGWIANNFMVTEDHAQLSALLKRSFAALGLEQVVVKEGQLDVETTFSHVPGQGLVPAFEVEVSLPGSVHSQVAGIGQRGRLWSFLRRFSGFLQERLPPHLQLVITMQHQDRPGQGWCMRGDGDAP